MQPDFSAGAVVYAKDMERVSTFYAHVAGLPVAHRQPDHVVLQSPAFQLTVVAMPAALAAQVFVASPPVRREDVALKLCFRVSNLAAARTLAAQWGGELNPPDREWEFQGLRVCDGHDPEGNVFQVRAPMV